MSDYGVSFNPYVSLEIRGRGYRWNAEFSDDGVLFLSPLSDCCGHASTVVSELGEELALCTGCLGGFEQNGSSEVRGTEVLGVVLGSRENVEAVYGFFEEFGLGNSYENLLEANRFIEFLRLVGEAHRNSFSSFLFVENC